MSFLSFPMISHDLQILLDRYERVGFGHGAPTYIPDICRKTKCSQTSEAKGDDKLNRRKKIIDVLRSLVFLM